MTTFDQPEDGERMMLDRVKNSRRLRVVAALFLVPLVLFSNPATATASAPWVEVSPTGDGGRCWLALQSIGTGLSVADGAFCTGGTDQSPGWAGNWEAGTSYTVTASGHQLTGGAVCSGSFSGVFGQHPSNGTLTVAGTIAASALNLGASDCQVTKVCVRSFFDRWQESGEATACATTTIAPEDAPPASTACEHGTPTTVDVSYERIGQGSYSVDYRVKVEVLGLTGPIYQPSYQGSAPVAGWNFALVLLPNDAHGGGWRGDWQGGGLRGPYYRSVDFSVAKTHVGGGVYRDPTDAEVKAAYPMAQGTEFLGVEVYWQPASAGDIYEGNVFPYSVSLPMPGGAYPQPNVGFAGITDAPRCRFYWGEKVAEVQGDWDVPMGNVGEPPDVPEPPPTPPVVEEPEDGIDWLAAIWAVLKAILSTLGGLATAIVNGILSGLGALVQAVLDGLEDLFVPGDGFFEDKAEQASDAFEGTTLDNYLAVVEGMVPAGSSGCQGPSVNFSSFGFDGGSQYPLSACGGPASTAAAATRLAISVGLGISATFACIRILGRALGWDPGLGGGQAS